MAREPNLARFHRSTITPDVAVVSEKPQMPFLFVRWETGSQAQLSKRIAILLVPSWNYRQPIKFELLRSVNDPWLSQKSSTVFDTSVKWKRTSRFVPDHFRRSEMSATLCLQLSPQNLGRQGKSENQSEFVKIAEKIGLGHPTRGIGRGHVWPVKEWAEGIGFEFVPCRKMFSERLVWGTYDRDKAN